MVIEGYILKLYQNKPWKRRNPV